MKKQNVSLAHLALAAALAFLAMPRLAIAVPQPGDPAADLGVDALLNATEGASVELADLKGKVVVVEFWATWCGPCIANMPHMNELTEALAGEEIVFVNVSDESAEVVEPFLERRPIAGWVGLDEGGDALKAYGITGIPHTVVIGRDGNVAGRGYPAQLSEAELRKALAGEPMTWGQQRVEDPEEIAAQAAIAKQQYLEQRRGSGFMPGRFSGEGLIDPMPRPIVQVIFRPALSPDIAGDGSMSRGDGTIAFTQQAATPEEIAGAIYSNRILFEAPAVDGEALYDMAVIAPTNAMMRQLAASAFEEGLGLRSETVEREVSVQRLVVIDDAKFADAAAKAPGYPSATYGEADGKTTMTLEAYPLQNVAANIEHYLKSPVLVDGDASAAVDLDVTFRPDDAASIDEALAAFGLGLKEASETLTFTRVYSTDATEAAME